MESKGYRWTRKLVGSLSLILVAATVVLGLWITPPDVVQGQLVRLIYVHPPVAWVAYLAYGVTSIASVLYLWKRTRNIKWDLLAASSAEVGVVFTGLTLVTGSIWGKPAWGVWWTWDARLTTTALLFVLYHLFQLCIENLLLHGSNLVPVHKHPCIHKSKRYEA